MRPKIVVIGGVSAAGKTRAAIGLARRLGGELIGADSVQVYRGFDIGSSKPSADELEGIPHHLLDVVNPDQDINAADFAKLADEAIDEVAGRGRVPIVVGGTGLWIRTLLRGLVELPEPDPELRSRLEARADQEGAPALHAELARVDPSAAGRIHPNDRLRIVRALEVFEQTGQPLGALQDAHALGAPRYEALTFVVDRPREALYSAIRARIQRMLEGGWIEEVKVLLERWGPDVRPMKSVGYLQIKQHLTEGISMSETERLAYKATCIYTRRQRTWFRSSPGDKTFVEGPEPILDQQEHIESWLRA